MTMLPEFKLETHFSKWEFRARYHMTASDAESMSVRELLTLATAEEREEFEGLWLGYTETFGAPDLREAIAATHANRAASDVLCFAGASEGIFAAPEGAATLAGLTHLIEAGWVQPDERIVLFNTGSGLKYLETVV